MMIKKLYDNHDLSFFGIRGVLVILLAFVSFELPIELKPLYQIIRETLSLELHFVEAM